MDCVGYVLDDNNPEKWPKENENIIKQYTNEQIDQNETNKGKKDEKGSGCNLI